MNRLLASMAVVGGLIIHASTTLAYLPGGPLEIGLQIIAEPVDGAQVILCKQNQVIDRQLITNWWLRLPKTGSDDSIECGFLSGNESISSECDEENPHCSTAHGSVTSRIIEQMENERVVTVELAAELGRVFMPPDAEEHSSDHVLRRNFNFTENRTMFVPLGLPGFSEAKKLGFREIYIKLKLKELVNQEEMVFGQIWLHSPLPNAEVYLDRGYVGELPIGGDLFLKNVTGGIHTIEVRSAGNQSISRAVRVVPGRRVYAEFTPDNMLSLTGSFQLQAMGRNAHGFEEYIRDADDAIVVRIPAGEFLMGNEDTERTPLEHKVHVSEFLMDKTGVTWGQFKRFLNSTGLPFPPHDPYWGINNDEPAVFVTWEESKNYCEWVGGRLPTEAEREKAARGTDERKFPWGDEEPIPELGVFRKSWGYEGPAAVGQHPKGASPYGLLDMGGNVWEWCSDWYAGDYYQTSPFKDPRGPETGRAHVVRGGSWDSRPSVLSSSCRSWGHLGYRDGDFGFRCAMNSPGPGE